MASPPPVVEPGANSSISIKLTVSSDDTLLSFERAAGEFAKGIDIKGFRKGSAIPTQVVAAQIGAEAVKSKAIQDLSDRALQTVGQQVSLLGESELVGGEDALIDRYNPGQELSFEITCDVWPTLTWVHGIEDIPALTVEQEPVDPTKVTAALKTLQERYPAKADTAEGYAAKLGDVVVGSMDGFRVNEDGSRGDPLPAVASGEGVEIVLESGKFMPGLVEGLVGATAGSTKEVRVSFPQEVSRNLGEELAGKAALFLVSVDGVKTRQLPELNDAFADSIRPGLTYELLYSEVRAAVGEEGDKRNANARNAAIEAELAKLVTTEIPETLLVQQAKEKFAQMMSDQRDAGLSDEELKKLITKDSFEKYKKVATKNIVRTFTSSLVVDELAKKEGLVADAATVEDQAQLMKAQAEQAGDKQFDEAMAKASVEATLKREAVMDWLAEKIDITYSEAAPELDDAFKPQAESQAEPAVL